MEHMATTLDVRAKTRSFKRNKSILFSSHFSKHETYINGVKQMSKSSFKAFVEYKGPEGGFRVKLADNADDLSEEETEDDDRASRCYSEITDSESDIQPYGAAQTKQQAEAKKRHDKAWFAAKELVDSEQSSHFSKHETYINGVKQMSKSSFKAFVEYKGPEGGFRVKLADNADDLSEEETEDDDRASRCYSEITDSESDIQPYGAAQTKQQAEAKKRHDKVEPLLDVCPSSGTVQAWFAAKELVDSEQRYVDKLRLLDELFRQRVMKEAAIDKDKQQKIFANVASLYQFHNTHFLPQLMEASRDWHTTKRIANVVRKQAPFLKMYSEYTNNYDRATKKLPECEGLPLSHHLICPVQRVMRYQLLLQEYKKQLNETDADFEDTAAALQLVLQAASHANEMMKKLDGFGKVIEVQEQLGNSISLVSPGRELLKTGTLQKISSTTEKTEERTVFLFNDLILLAGERKMIGLGKYRLRAVFHACHTQVCEGDNLEREHSFYIRGSDGNGPSRCVELYTDTQKDKNDWVESICSVIEDCRANSATFGGSVKSSLCETNNNHAESRNCADCDSEFSLFYRGIKCGKCKRKLCKKCFGRYRTESKNNRICEPCVKNM
ncbi:RhoGEF domain protein, partial [Ancylostoma ceylanicum]